MSRGKKNILIGKEMRASTAVRTCPVTNGLPTTMTLEGFKAACDQCRDRRPDCFNPRAYKYSWCDICQGKKLPHELRVASLEQLKRQRAARQYAKNRGMRHSQEKQERAEP